VTYGTLTWIWSVAVDDDLYVRAYNGSNSSWYKAAMQQKAGRIVAAGATKEVTFEAVEGPINDRIDDAYRGKYRASPYLKPMIGASARAATSGSFRDSKLKSRHMQRRLGLEAQLDYSGLPAPFQSMMLTSFHGFLRSSN
jgi:hypothetical protein